MDNFDSLFALSGTNYEHWDEDRTQRELRLHLVEVAFRLDCVHKQKEKIRKHEQRISNAKDNGEDTLKLAQLHTDLTKLKSKLAEEIHELSKEAPDLLILVKHFVLTSPIGGGKEGIKERHLKFAAQ